MTEEVDIYKAENHQEASSCLSNLIANDISSNKSEPYSIGLSGGNTPKLAYSMMLNDIKDFSNIALWTVDERWLPITDENSNQKMINSSFKSTNANILEIPFSDEDPFKDAETYSKLLDDNINKFNTGIIGLGDDGHIASLFPGTAALNEKTKLIVANEVNIVSKWRITASYKLLSKISKLYLLATGENKREILKKAINGSELPINKLFKLRENTVIITDQDI